jgi:hypothetical protein
MSSPAPAPVEEKKISTAKNVGIGAGLGLSACITLALGIAFGNWLTKNSQEVMSNTQEKAAHWFEKFALFGKGGLIVSLIVLALLNGHGSYVSENPKKFMQDALATGGFGAIAAVFLTLTRGRPDLLMNHFVFALLLFFLYHVCREFAGYFTVFGSEQMTDKEKAQENKLAKPILIVLGVAALVAIGLAVTARVSPDLSQGIFKSLSPSLAFALETIIFVAIITGGEVIVARNHDDPLGPVIGTSAMMFTIAHLMLQGGGFYSHLYPVVPPSIE